MTWNRGDQITNGRAKLLCEIGRGSKNAAITSPVPPSETVRPEEAVLSLKAGTAGVPRQGGLGKTVSQY